MLPSSQGDAADVSDGSQEPDSNFITEQWVKQLSFVKVRQCKLCHHSSNEINPLRRGPFKRSTRWPVWPWLQGTYALPRGAICRVCQYVFSLGGFQEQHGDTMTLVKKQAESDTLTKEFSVCAAKMIDLINAGEVSMRCRGNKRSAVEASLAESRKRTVELIKSEALRVKDKFKAIMLSQWEAENPGKDAREEGYAVKSLQVPGQESRVPCVLMRKGPKNTWDVELDKSIVASIHEEFDSGTATLRAGQQDAKYNHLAQSLGTVAALDDKAKDFKAYCQLKPEHLPYHTSAAQGSGMQQCPQAATGKAGDEAVPTGAESSGSSDESQDFDPMACSLLSGIMEKPKPKGETKEAKGEVQVKQVKGKKPQIKAGAAKNQEASVARAKPAAPAPSPLMKKGRGKGSRIPVEAHDILRFEGFLDKEEVLNNEVAKLKESPFDRIPLDADARSQESRTLAEINTNLLAIIVDFTKIETKLTRRSNTPQHALDSVRASRKLAKDIAACLSQLAKPAYDLEKTKELISTLAGTNVSFGVGLQAKLYCMEASEEVRYGRLAELLSLMIKARQGFAKDCDMEHVWAMNHAWLEGAFLRTVKSLASGAERRPNARSRTRGTERKPNAMPERAKKPTNTAEHSARTQMSNAERRKESTKPPEPPNPSRERRSRTHRTQHCLCPNAAPNAERRTQRTQALNAAIANADRTQNAPNAERKRTERAAHRR